MVLPSVGELPYSTLDVLSHQCYATYRTIPSHTIPAFEGRQAVFQSTNTHSFDAIPLRCTCCELASLLHCSCVVDEECLAQLALRCHTALGLVCDR